MNTQTAQIAAQAVSAELKRRNLPVSKLPLVMHQLAVESAGFTSNISANDNNFSGIKYFGQKQAVKGAPVPNSEYIKGAKFGNFYAKYDTVNQWAEDYLNVLQKFGNPLDANTLEDFATRLKNGNNGRSYFQATLPDYIKALKSWTGTFAKYLPEIKVSAGTVSIVAVIALVVIIYLISKN